MTKHDDETAFAMLLMPAAHDAHGRCNFGTITASAMHKVFVMRELLHMLSLLGMLSLLVQHETLVVQYKNKPGAYYVRGKSDAHEVWDNGALKTPTSSNPE